MLTARHRTLEGEDRDGFGAALNTLCQRLEELCQRSSDVSTAHHCSPQARRHGRRNVA
jgi:hypothetical protein